MSDPIDLADLTPLVDLLLFGTTDPDEDAEGGVMAALELEESQIVEADDPGERPVGLFLTYKLFDTSGPLYGQPIEDYVAVEEDPEADPDDGVCLLRYDNATTVILRLELHAPALDHTDLEIRAMARRAQRYLKSVANRELTLLGLDAYIADFGQVRNATTILNEQVERVFAFDATCVVGESFTVQVDTFDTVTLSFQEGTDGDEEEKEFTP